MCSVSMVRVSLQIKPTLPSVKNSCAFSIKRSTPAQHLGILLPVLRTPVQKRVDGVHGIEI